MEETRKHLTIDNADGIARAVAAYVDERLGTEFQNRPRRWELTVMQNGWILEGNEGFGQQIVDSLQEARCGDLIVISVLAGVMYTRYIGEITEFDGTRLQCIAQQFIVDNETDETCDRFHITAIFGVQGGSVSLSITKLGGDDDGLNEVFMTEAQYNALSTKDSNTLYYIYET